MLQDFQDTFDSVFGFVFRQSGFFGDTLNDTSFGESHPSYSANPKKSVIF
jgi:hypothetical protein